VIAAGVALGVGVVVGALAFGGDDAADVPEGAAADAAAGCQLLRGLPESIPDPRDDDDDDGLWSFDGPMVWRLQGASGAFSAAGRDGREYRSLADDGEVLYRAVQQLAVEDANEALDDLRDWCADNDLGDD
jgi:hypothetical protein